MNGNFCELLVATQATKQGYNVSFPFSDSLPYDCIIDTGERLLRAQIKGSEYIEGGSLTFAINRSSMSGKKRKYEKGDFDILILVDKCAESIYIFLPDEVGRKIKIRENGKYEERKNDWRIIGRANYSPTGAKN